MTETAAGAYPEGASETKRANAAGGRRGKSKERRNADTSLGHQAGTGGETTPEQTRKALAGAVAAQLHSPTPDPPLSPTPDANAASCNFVHAAQAARQLANAIWEHNVQGATAAEAEDAALAAQKTSAAWQNCALAAAKLAYARSKGEPAGSYPRPRAPSPQSSPQGEASAHEASGMDNAD